MEHCYEWCSDGDHVIGTTLDLAKTIVELASDKQASDIVLLDVQELTPFADYCIVMTGDTVRHMNGLEREIAREIKSHGYGKPLIEGSRHGEWVLIDSNGLNVHILGKSARSYYQLEKLWSTAPMIITVQ